MSSPQIPPTPSPSRLCTNALPALCPAQASAHARIVDALAVAPVVGLMGRPGSGRSTITRHLATRPGARLITISDVYKTCKSQNGARWDEAVGDLLTASVTPAGLVIIDCYDDLLAMSATASMRGRLLHLLHHRLMQEVSRQDARLVLTGLPPQNFMAASDVFGEEAIAVQIPGFLADDYAAFLRQMLGAEQLRAVDFKQVHRYASMLSGHQLRRLGAILKEQNATLDTALVIRNVQTHILASNTRLEEVEALSFDRLPGTAHIAEALETHVILPFEQPALAQSMGLRPKRGVLLHGRPGTGKTSIGRALAHRIKGKFFLIDGSVHSEPPGAFFDQLKAIVQQAKSHAPSVLFIDDADVLFGIQHIAGLPRYLLSLLDGLESEGAREVCVVMTAMDAGRIPAALLRSGRIELWLETRLPDAGIRLNILRQWLGNELPGSDEVMEDLLAEATIDFTAADLRRVVADAKTLYAVDCISRAPLQDAMFYLAQAINAVVTARSRMANLLQDNHLRIGRELTITAAA